MTIKVVMTRWDILVKVDVAYNDRGFGIGLRNQSSSKTHSEENYVIVYTHGWDSNPHKLGLFEYNLDHNALRSLY